MESVNSQKSRILYIDILRVLASISVVFIHCATMVHNVDLIHTKQWLVSDLINSLARWCVPIFFMISGATTLDYRKRYSTAIFYKKRFIKVLIPFIIWTGVYLIWGASVGLLQINSLGDVIRRSISEPAMYHLWFFYSLLGIYLVVPVLSLITTHASKRLLYALVLLCIFTNQVLPLITKFTSFTFWFHIPLTDSYLGYFLLGWLLKDVAFKRSIRYGLYLAGLLSVAATAVLSYLLSQKGEDLYFMNYETLTTLFSTLAVFVLIKNVHWERILLNKPSCTLLSELANASFGIYLIHIIVKHYFVEIFHLIENSIGFMTVGAVFVYLISFIIVMILRRIPMIKNLVP